MQETGWRVRIITIQRTPLVEVLTRQRRIGVFPSGGRRVSPNSHQHDHIAAHANHPPPQIPLHGGTSCQDSLG